MVPDDPSIGYLLHWAARLMRRLADRKLQPLGLSSGHLPVLTALMGHEALSQKALTAFAGIEQPTMAATLARMERDAIVRRRPDPCDKRSSLFSLTPLARSRIGALQDVIQGLNTEALAVLPEPDRERFRHMLRTVVTALDARLGGQPDP